MRKTYDTAPEMHAVGATPPDFVLREPVSLGPFDITERIGVGGMGEVWRGVHRAQGLPVAVKVLTSMAARDEAALAAFTNEVRAVAGFDHPNIITVFDYGKIDAAAQEQSFNKVVDGCPYLVMELASGGWLDATLVQLPWWEIQAMLTSLLDALAHAHARGVIHRDLKPENILLPRRDALWSELKMTDFGIAHAAEWLDDSATDPMSGAGTPHYMAPEQIYCRWRDQGPWTDLYAIGCLAWELLCGFPPFDYVDVNAVVDAQLRETPPALNAKIDVPPGIEGWLHRLLAKRPEDRFRRAADALWALVKLSPPSTQPRSSTPEVPAPRSAPGAPAHQRSNTVRLPNPRSATVTDLPVRDIDAPTEPTASASELPASALWNRKIPPFPPTWKVVPSAAEPQTMQFIGAGLGLYGVRTIPLVDREAERDVLWRSMRNVRSSGSARLVALRGPSGVGKTRLAEWICHRAHEVGSATVLKAVHAEAATPSTGLAPMMEHHFRCVGMPRPAIRQRLQRLLTQGGVDDPYEWHAFTEILTEGREVDPDPSGQGVTFTSAAQRFAVLRRELTRLAKERPVIVWLDDAHYSREALAFARYLLRFRTGLPVLIVLTIQDEAIAERPEAQALLSAVLQQNGTIDMRVGPLDEAGTLELVRRLLMFEGELTGRIAGRVAGNPAFAATLVGDWVRRGVLGVGRNGFVVPPGAETELPDDIYTVWSQRLARFVAGIPNDDARIAIEIAAALGRRFDVWEWHVACVEYGLGADGPRSGAAAVTELTRALTEDLLDENLVREDATHKQLVFVHSMVRESLERDSREGDRWREINRACANMLAKSYPVDMAAERLGRHQLAGEDYVAAIEPLLRGARVRWQKGALTVALDLLAERDDALLRAQIGEEDARWGQGWVVRAQVHAERGELEEAAGWATAAEIQAQRCHDDDAWRGVRAETLLVTGGLSFKQGDLMTAKSQLASAWEIYDQLGTQLQQARCAMTLGEVQVAAGEFSHGADLLTAALELFQIHGSAHDQARALRALGELAWVVGNADDALSLYQRALSVAQGAGDRLLVGQSMQGLAEVARSRGNLDEAESSYGQALDVLRDLEADWQPLRAKLALVKLQKGEFDEARLLLDKALVAAQKRRRPLEMGRIAAMSLACASHDLNWERFDELCGVVSRHLNDSEVVDPDVAWTASLAGDLAASAGQSQRSRAAYTMALRQWQALGKTDRATRLQQLLRSL